MWSYSSLGEVEACARRYALRRATYDGLWGRSGYPDSQNEASLVGTAVHNGVELTLKAMSAAGCRSVGDEGAVEVLRSLGGFTMIAHAGIRRALDGLEDNPRVAPRLDQLEQRLDRRVGEMRAAIQTFVSRATLIPAKTFVRPGSAKTRPASLERGTHPEVELRANGVRMTGRVDLITVQASGADLVDFKTGEASATHADQLRLYGFLWISDQLANPSAAPVASLTIAYQDGDVAVDVPHGWAEIERALLGRVADADRALEAEPPVASPSSDCRHCPVRHMCDAYWGSEHVHFDPPRTDFVDAQLTLLRRHGPTSWSTQVDDAETAVLLRLPTSHDADALATGSTVRVLGGLIGSDPDSGHQILTLTRASEIFQLHPDGE